jgi:hypothetical protein
VRPGEILSEAWALYRAHWTHLIAIALVVYLVTSLLGLLLIVLLGAVGAVLSALVTFVAVFWLQGALVEAVADIRDGRADLSIRETFARVGERLGPIVGAGLLAGLGIAVGLLLLIVPGLVLLTWWSVVIPVVVLERVGVMQAFGRSRALVRGNGWNVFGTIVLTVLVLIAIGIVFSIVLAPLPSDLATYLSQVVGNSITAPFAALAWTLMYYRLAGERPVAVEPAPF